MQVQLRDRFNRRGMFNRRWLMAQSPNATVDRER